MTHMTKAACMLLVIILPAWSADSCNMDIIKMESFVELIQEQAKVNENLNKTVQEQGDVIAEYKATIESLNNTIKQKEEDCKRSTEALNTTIQEVKAEMATTIQEQGQECKNMKEALNRTVQQLEAEVAVVKADVQDLKTSDSKFVISTLDTIIFPKLKLTI